MSRSRLFRVTTGAAGAALLGYGLIRLVTDRHDTNYPYLVRWMIAAVAVHDGVVVPLVCAVGFVLSRSLPPRARRHLQGTLIVGAALTLIAIPMIYLEGGKAAPKAWLQQDYGRNLFILWVIVVGAGLACYATSALLGRRRHTNGLP